MQLLGINQNQFYRNRLTHSLEVSQISRSIALKCGYSLEDSYVVEAASLAHDIGNPPFGHYGEKILNELSDSFGGFEGNAQTLRTLTTLESKQADLMGLNLTYRTLLGVTKYFVKRDCENGLRNKKFVYDDDFDFLIKFVDRNDITVRTLDVQIMDIADEIAYAAHDLEDGLKRRLFTIDEILFEFYRMDNMSYKKLKEIVEGSREKFYDNISNNCNSHITSATFDSFLCKEITSCIIYNLIEDVYPVSVNEDKRKYSKQRLELGFKNYSKLAALLKRITFTCICDTNDVYRYEQKGEIILRELYKLYCKKPKYLPPEYRTDSYPNKNIDQKRLTIDYLAGLMDTYAYSLYDEFKNSGLLAKRFVKK